MISDVIPIGFHSIYIHIICPYHGISGLYESQVKTTGTAKKRQYLHANRPKRPLLSTGFTIIVSCALIIICCVVIYQSSALFPLFTHSSNSDFLNLHSLPILWAGISVFFIQLRMLSFVTPRCLAASVMFIQFLSILLIIMPLFLRHKEIHSQCSILKADFQVFHMILW